MVSGGVCRQRWSCLSLLLVAGLACLARCAGAVKLRAAELNAPPSFLLISSPTQRKVSYVELAGNSVAAGLAVHTAVRALVDAGLSAPHGIALDSTSKNLYVADMGLQKIVHYHVRPLQCGLTVARTDPRCDNVTASGYILGTVGVQTTIVQGVTSNWLTIDPDSGAMFYTDQATNSVNRLSHEAIMDLIAGTLKPSDTGRFTQRNLQALTEASKAASMGSENHRKLLDSLMSQIDVSITTLFQKGVSENVATPAGVAADNGLVFWANRVDGDKVGSVASGLADPLDEQAASATPNALDTHLNVRSTATAYGLAVTSNSIIFTDDKQYVYGARKDGGGVVTISSSMLTPRGLVWDGDGTMFIADFDKNEVLTFPCGKIADSMHFSSLVSIHNPWGVALLRPGVKTAFQSAAFQAGAGYLWLFACQAVFMLTWHLH
eukprot:TRINITY_DN92215_c0_g1_i1.p1 TRINITY_DN92215_c0_g1~~TRINITY_DN92215_c0_g1_i1.p1  ORF type:complete len:435 (-),score=64.09 TRINITY_DN92215_c0_g1_i1:133-1437(-)